MAESGLDMRKPDDVYILAFDNNAKARDRFIPNPTTETLGERRPYQPSKKECSQPCFVDDIFSVFPNTSFCLSTDILSYPRHVRYCGFGQHRGRGISGGG
jgi:hypothetical protein